MKIGILGGGISGISLAYFLSDKHEVTVLEASENPGGLCATRTVGDFKYDLGGHIAYSKYEEVNNLIESLLGDNCLYRPMNTKEIFYEDDYMKYPFHDSLSHFSDKEKHEFISSYMNRDQNLHIKTIKDWFVSNLGERLAQHDLMYTSKLWKYPCHQMLADWIDRIPKTKLQRIIDSAFDMIKDEQVKMFKYPKTGGFQTIVGKMVEVIKNVGFEIRTDSRVTEIREHFYATGKRFEVICDPKDNSIVFDKIVVTYPLKDLISDSLGKFRFNLVPDRIVEASNNLKHNSLAVVFLGFDCVPDVSYLEREAIYISDPNILTHRVCFPCYFSPEMAPHGKASLTAEVTYLQGDTIDKASDKELSLRVIEDLASIGIIKFRDEIEVTEVVRCKYAYPIYDIDYRINTNLTKYYIRNIGIELLGRFAQWEYINSDECIYRAMKLAEKLNAQD